MISRRHVVATMLAAPAILRLGTGTAHAATTLKISHQFPGGTIDNVAASEEDCIAQIRRFLSFLPQSVWNLPPVVSCGDPPERRQGRVGAADLVEGARPVREARGVAEVDDALRRLLEAGDEPQQSCFSGSWRTN